MKHGRYRRLGAKGLVSRTWSMGVCRGLRARGGVVPWTCRRGGFRRLGAMGGPRTWRRGDGTADLEQGGPRTWIGGEGGLRRTWSTGKGYRGLGASGGVTATWSKGGYRGLGARRGGTADLDQAEVVPRTCSRVGLAIPAALRAEICTGFGPATQCFAREFARGPTPDLSNDNDETNEIGPGPVIPQCVG